MAYLANLINNVYQTLKTGTTGNNSLNYFKAAYLGELDRPTDLASPFFVVHLADPASVEDWAGSKNLKGADVEIWVDVVCDYDDQTVPYGDPTQGKKGIAVCMDDVANWLDNNRALAPYPIINSTVYDYQVALGRFKTIGGRSYQGQIALKLKARFLSGQR